MPQDATYQGSVSVTGGAENVGYMSCINNKPSGGLFLLADKGKEHWTVQNNNDIALWVYTRKFPAAKARLTQAYLSDVTVTRTIGSSKKTWRHCYAWVDVSWSSLINPGIFQFDVYVFTDKLADNLIFYWDDIFFGTLSINREVSCGSLPF